MSSAPGRAARRGPPARAGTLVSGPSDRRSSLSATRSPARPTAPPSRNATGRGSSSLQERARRRTPRSRPVTRRRGRAPPGTRAGAAGPAAARPRGRAPLLAALHRLGRDLVDPEAGEPVDALLVDPPPGASCGGLRRPTAAICSRAAPGAPAQPPPSRARSAIPMRSSAVGVGAEPHAGSPPAGRARQAPPYEPLLEADGGVRVARDRQSPPLGLALVGAADPGDERGAGLPR